MAGPAAVRPLTRGVEGRLRPGRDGGGAGESAGQG